MSRARYDNRSGYRSFFGGEAIQFGREMHNKFYGERESYRGTAAKCPAWSEVGTDFAKIKKFAAMSAGARTLTISDGDANTLGGEDINIGGRQYKLDATGSVRLLGKDWMQNEINIIQERQQFLTEVAKSIVWGGDQLAVQILGVNAYVALAPCPPDHWRLLKANQALTPIQTAERAYWNQFAPNVPLAMMAINAQPSDLRSLPSSSEQFAHGLNKIYYIVEHTNIAFDDDVVHAEKVGAPLNKMATSAPHGVAAPGDTGV